MFHMARAMRASRIAHRRGLKQQRMCPTPPAGDGKAGIGEPIPAF
jgi:hypothetical protein